MQNRLRVPSAMNPRDPEWRAWLCAPPSPWSLVPPHCAFLAWIFAPAERPGDAIFRLKCGQEIATSFILSGSCVSRCPMENLPQQQSEIKQLITKGREQGYLTYAEVNDHLPDDIVDPEQIEDIIGMINGMGIEVHEIAPDTDMISAEEIGRASCRARETA